MRKKKSLTNAHFEKTKNFFGKTRKKVSEDSRRVFERKEN